MNRVILTGRIGHDIDLKKTNTGNSMVKLRLAVRVNKDQTDWHSVTAWDNTADKLSQYAHKGDLIIIEGRLTKRTVDEKTYTDIVASRIEILSHSEKQQPKGGTFTAPEPEDPLHGVEPTLWDELPY